MDHGFDRYVGGGSSLPRATSFRIRVERTSLISVRAESDPIDTDTDIVLFDPNLKKTITVPDLYADSDCSIWDGFEPEVTW